MTGRESVVRRRRWLLVLAALIVIVVFSALRRGPRITSTERNCTGADCTTTFEITNTANRAVLADVVFSTLVERQRLAYGDGNLLVTTDVSTEKVELGAGFSMKITREHALSERVIVRIQKWNYLD